MGVACVGNRYGRIFRRGMVGSLGARPSKPVYLPPVEFSRDNRIYSSYRSKLYERPVERGHTRFLYQGYSRRFIFTILLKSLFHEKSLVCIRIYLHPFLPLLFSSFIHFFFFFFFLPNASSFIKPSFHSTRINVSPSRRASEEFLDRSLFFLGQFPPCRSTRRADSWTRGGREANR